MLCGVRWPLIGSVFLGLVGVLAGCTGRFMAEREPWRHDAEVACLTAGSVREGEGKVRIKPISGPGMCGADFPMKVSALGDSALIGYSDELRPPSAIPGGSTPRWPVNQQPAYPASQPPAY